MRPKRREAIGQIVDLVVRERQTQLDIGRGQGRPPGAQQIDPLGRTRLGRLEQPLRRVQIEQRHLGHAVVQDGRRLPRNLAAERASLRRQAEFTVK